MLSAALLPANKEVLLSFRVSMRSVLKRSASDLRIYVNFPPSFDPIEVRYGSSMERVSSNMRIGKGGCKYLVVDRVRVSRREPIGYEDFVVKVRTSSVAGEWLGWTTVFAHGSVDDCGVDRFKLRVQDRP